MTETADRLDAIYRTVPVIQCRGLCHESCGPIMMTRAEYDRLVGNTEVKQIIAVPADRLNRGQVEHITTHSCPLLVNGRCSRYAVRPLICRLFGTTHMMACPFGCQPSRWVTDDEATAMLMRAEIIGGESVTIMDPTA